jgi:hypothetical protein
MNKEAAEKNRAELYEKVKIKFEELSKDGGNITG